MTCLFLDTSSEFLRLSLIKDDDILYEKNIITKNDHSSYLVPFIDEAFKKNNVKFDDLDRLIVGIGPGSFTGTRISITVAKVYAYLLKIPIIGISSLEIMIYNNDNNYDYYIPIIEEKNNNVYYAIFDKDRKRIIEDTLSSIDDVFYELNKYSGKKLIISHKGIKYDNYDCVDEVINALEINKNIFINNEEINPHLLKPNYIKKIDAESKK